MSTEMCPVESPAWPGAAGFHLRSFLEVGLAGGGVLAAQGVVDGQQQQDLGAY